MSNHLKLLDGTVEQIIEVIAGLSADDRAELLKAEQDGKTRKGVIAALQPEGDSDKPANIEPATQFAPSGAPIQSVPDVDPSHPAVDADPRAHTTEAQNRIDFNDPSKSGVDVVSEQLGMTKPDGIATAGAGE